MKIFQTICTSVLLFILIQQLHTQSIMCIHSHSFYSNRYLFISSKNVESSKHLRIKNTIFLLLTCIIIGSINMNSSRDVRGKLKHQKNSIRYNWYKGTVHKLRRQKISKYRPFCMFITQNQFKNINNSIWKKFPHSVRPFYHTVREVVGGQIFAHFKTHI